MKTGIMIEEVWRDADVVQFRFTCSNGYFSGQAEIYAGHDELSRMAATVSGFPSHPDDSRNVDLGTLNHHYAGGGVQMRFYCVDSAGHAAVEVKLRGDACPGFGEAESVALRMPVEAAAIDSFAGEIAKMENTVSATASLEMASQ